MDATAPSPRRRAFTLFELGLVLVAALFSIWFYASKPSRMPREAEYERAVAAIRANFQTGDAVAILPDWAERIRSMLPGVPFVSAPTVGVRDLSRVKRLWVVELPSLPRAEVPDHERELAAKLTADGAPQEFGHVVLKRYVNPNFHEPKFDFTRDIGRANVWIQAGQQTVPCPLDGTAHRCGRGAATVQHEVREIDFAPYDCVGANPVGRGFPTVIDYPDAILGKQLDVMAAVTGEMGWRHTPGLTPVDFAVFVDNQPMAHITIGVGTVPPQRQSIDTSKLDPNATHDVRFEVSTANPQDREFCFDAQSE